MSSEAGSSQSEESWQDKGGSQQTENVDYSNQTKSQGNAGDMGKPEIQEAQISHKAAELKTREKQR